MENEQTHQLINTIQFCLKFTHLFSRDCILKYILAIKCEEISNYSFHQQHVGFFSPHLDFAY